MDLLNRANPEAKPSSGDSANQEIAAICGILQAAAGKTKTYAIATYHPKRDLNPEPMNLISLWRYAVAFSVTALFVSALVAYKTYTVVSFLINAVVALWAWARFATSPRRLARMMDIPSPQPQFPVLFTHKSKLRTVVRDHGIVTFTDRLLHFEGRRLSFTIDNEPVIKSSFSSGSRNWLFGAHIPFWFRWSYRGSSGQTSFRVYETVEGVGSGFHGEFQVALTEWVNGMPATSGTFALPPGFGP